MKRAATLYVTSIADGIGALSATVCALHCIALPAILIVGTAVPTVFLDDESFHRAMCGWSYLLQSWQLGLAAGDIRTDGHCCWVQLASQAWFCQAWHYTVWSENSAKSL